jgi:glyoxalase family protein
MKTLGIHHVTAMSGAAQENLDFYAGTLGQRFVKKTVNFDDPGTYHLYYGDQQGSPGTIMTFFPWANAVQGSAGNGMIVATGYSAPEGAAAAWAERLGGDAAAVTEHFGASVFAFTDPHGMPLEVVENAGAPSGLAYEAGGVDAAEALRGFHSVTLRVARPDATARVLTGVLGLEEVGEEDGRLRFAATSSEGTPGQVVDLVLASPEHAARPGKGTYHHVAFRAANDHALEAFRSEVQDAGLRVTPHIDRQYFHSIYFREPSSVLFEIATDPPGFTLDEPLDALGTSLVLPPQHEPLRAQLEQRLPKLTVPTR